jgi:hypothetical protein
MNANFRIKNPDGSVRYINLNQCYDIVIDKIINGKKFIVFRFSETHSLQYSDENDEIKTSLLSVMDYLSLNVSNPLMTERIEK